MTKQEALKQFAEFGAVPELHREAGLREFPYGNDVMV